MSKSSLDLKRKKCEDGKPDTNTLSMENFDDELFQLECQKESIRVEFEKLNRRVKDVEELEYHMAEREFELEEKKTTLLNEEQRLNELGQELVAAAQEIEANQRQSVEREKRLEEREAAVAKLESEYKLRKKKLLEYESKLKQKEHEFKMAEISSLQSINKKSMAGDDSASNQLFHSTAATTTTATSMMMNVNDLSSSVAVQQSPLTPSKARASIAPRKSIVPKPSLSSKSPRKVLVRKSIRTHSSSTESISQLLAKENYPPSQTNTMSTTTVSKPRPSILPTISPTSSTKY